MREGALSEFRIEKQRARAIVTLSHAPSAAGCFFVAPGGAIQPGPERVADLLNEDAGFFPFEVSDGEDATTVLLNRDHVVAVALADNEAARDSAYAFAVARPVSLLLTTGERLRGTVRVYRPAGRDRLSDWARDRGRFRYIETATGTVIVNIDHVIEAREEE
jgi:hypothetical protein